MKIFVSDTPSEASKLAAAEFKALIRLKSDAVLGLATGGTPLLLYRELIEACGRKEISFKKIRTFNLDEYVGLSASNPRSFRSFMDENLFNHIDIERENIRVPNGISPDFSATCAEYEAAIKKAGGIDLQLLGIGSDGHIGFNEPMSAFSSRTRIETLTPKTIADNAKFFDGNPEFVPTRAITMGIATIMDSRSIALLAFGESKADIVARMVCGDIDESVPASVLRRHSDVMVFLDTAAASKLPSSILIRA